SGLAVLLGCRKHSDRRVLLLSMTGLAILASVALYESVFTSSIFSPGDLECSACCPEAGSGMTLTGKTLFNILGGITLAGAHVRNFLLGRRTDCHHH
ncbi:MAG: MerC family mercury resistance protein, partial [Verrucomicrobiota bacterium]